MSSTCFHICDTNVWYGIHQGHFDLDRLTKGGGEPCLAFSSLCELVGMFKESNFAARKAICQTILKVQPRMLPDSESFVSGDDKAPTNWLGCLQAVAESDYFDE